MQLGGRQPRYFGRAKTKLQWQISATVANLTLALGFRRQQGAGNPPHGSTKAAATPHQDLSATLKTAFQRLIRPTNATSASTDQNCPMAA